MRQPSAMDDYLFDLRGFVIVKNALEPDLLDELNDAFDRFPRDLPIGSWYQGAQRRDYTPDTGMELHHCLEMGEPFTRLIDHPSWLDYVSKYCGEASSYVEGLFIDECMTSIRNSGGYHPLHSGGFQTPMRCQYAYQNGVFRCGQVNVLMALTDIGPGDGATMVIPGSHKSNFPLPTMEAHQYGGEKESELPELAIEAHLQKGDALLFVDAITHGGVNRINDGERRVIIFRYGPPWGNTRYGYEYSPQLLESLTPMRRSILEPQRKIREGDERIPVEAITIRAQRLAEQKQSVA
jgi:ectoine hydroxylase-related dioxygenase (phytanoyl-CoA dioxygenase family)